VITHRLNGTSRAEQLALLGFLARADAERTTAELDLTPLDAGNPSKRRLGGQWVSVVSNLLIGRYADLPLVVRLPEANSIQLQLMRSAFYFALAQRPGLTTILAQSARSSSLIQANSGVWSPREGPVLFPIAEGDKVEERQYLYANTHVRAESGYYRRYESSAAFPWIGDVVPRPTSTLADELRELFISATCDTLAEVMDNVSTHAFNLRDSSFFAGWLGTGVVDRARSGLLVSLTAGGQGSFDRLHFLAFDNGFSIPRTLRWQHSRQLRLDPAHDLIERVLQRRFDDRHIADHNGAGLWFLYGLARFAGGTITLTTEDDQSDGRTGTRVHVEVEAAESSAQSRWSSGTVDAPVRGTILHLQVRVPSLDETDPNVLATRIEDFQRYRSIWPAMA
jgi:hypothetical protein